MQRWTKACLAAGLMVAMSAAVSPAMAQRPGGGQGRGGFGGGRGFGGGGMTVFSALRAEAVQKELALTEEQKTKVTALGEEVQTATRELFGQGGFGRGEGERPSPEEMAKRMAEIREKTEKVVSEKKTALAAIISADQLARLEQIVIQAKGPDALLDSDVQAKLSVTDEQKSKLTSTSRDFAEKEREAFSGLFGRREGGEGGRPDPEAMRAATEKRDAVRKEKETAMVAVLSPAQAEQFDALKGKPFAELDAVRRGGFGGGAFGGGRGRGGDRPNRPATEN